MKPIVAPAARAAQSGNADAARPSAAPADAFRSWRRDSVKWSVMRDAPDWLMQGRSHRRRSSACNPRACFEGQISQRSHIDGPVLVLTFVAVHTENDQFLTTLTA